MARTGNQDEFELWGKWLGHERQHSYLAVARHLTSQELAIWNQRITSALLEDVAHTEIAFRNLVSNTLLRRLERLGYEGHWLSDPDSELRRCGGALVIARIKDASERASRLKGKTSESDVIAELSLGFWAAFFSKSFKTFHPDLVSAFEGSPNRSFASLPRTVGDFHRLRNRLAHHHRMIHRDLASDYQSVLRLAQLIDPRLCEFVSGASQTTKVISGFSAVRCNS